ncbi:D-alpha,beta-D-heptose 1,7-bisphosphate phosphatase [Kushneria sinocarnis]|uniref:D,D-heptose 1,7-bisphosphate phosphatase n=1 Tax=Kushneria sinocarnis TaxID=595502 RepID=A0A420X0D7_9GAMM|nr:D-glycero-beta-D-manno-heptose 1,7-bisphosphate 7-phosphatase [Kushneria sinocarnis]RKR07318.1 D-alpha,beta-D-heptose 1,7-bisphosphate phosphatase [Kushneria sinocarnis]
MSEGLVILDRDGVINEDSEEFIRSPEQWIAMPQALEAIALLHRGDWQIAVATNQSGIARGYFDESVLTAMHDKMRHEVRRYGGELAHVAWCPHGPDDASDSRKPRPGMLFEIREALGLASLDGAWMVGDSLRDLQAGRSAGCRVALVLTGKGRITLGDLDQVERPEDVVVADSLLDFARRLLAGELRSVTP